MFLAGNGVFKNFQPSRPITGSPKAVFFCNKATNTQTTYVLSKEKVNNLGQVLSVNPLQDPPSKDCNGWWMDFKSKNVEIIKIPGVNVNKAVAVMAII
jgi:hypothetical protein